MSKVIRFSIIPIVLLAIYACLIPSGTSTPGVLADTALRLTVQVQNAGDVFNTVGQVIKYNYTVTNTGTTPIAGPVTITDSKTAPTCPNVNTIGNLDGNLDLNENLICAASYSITQADLNAGSVASKATAQAAGRISNEVPTTVTITLNKVLSLTATANPTTYSQTGQAIALTFAIKNTGTATLGPAQFIVSADKLGAAINCGGANQVLAANESVSCNATYTTVQNDMSATQISFNITASGAGAGVAQSVSLVITNTTPPATNTPSSNLTPGSTVAHKVEPGQWLLQITRCYGADYDAVRAANPQVGDPNVISPGETISVPNIGSKGKIYYPNCFDSYSIQSNDSWESIAQKFNADVCILKAANIDKTFSTGVVLRIPENSANSYLGSCSAVSTPTGDTTATRITFPAGSTTVTLSGSTSSQGRARYIVAASQGQTLSVKVTGNATELALAVRPRGEAALKKQDSVLTWSGTIPSTGDYLIDIIGIPDGSNRQFTLEVTLTGGTTPPQSFERVADINTGVNNSDPAYLALFNGNLYFRATGGDNTGAELWKYDGNLKGVSRAADIFSGPDGSNPAYLTEYNGALYFSANGNDNAGTELWRFNGNAAGRVGDIYLGSGSSNPSYLTVYNGYLYFSANGNDGKGVELWRSDGTTATRVTDIHADAGDSNPAYLTTYNNVLYFSAVGNDGKGVELWKYDGTNATRVTDINPETGNANPSYMKVFNGILYFSANGGTDGKGTELWKFDGTNASLAADINPGAGDSGPTFLTEFKGALYFSANANDGKGTELFKFDGTNATRVSDLNTTSNSNPAYLCVYNNELYFSANANDGTGTELWKYKGP